MICLGHSRKEYGLANALAALTVSPKSTATRAPDICRVLSRTRSPGEDESVKAALGKGNPRFSCHLAKRLPKNSWLTTSWSGTKVGNDVLVNGILSHQALLATDKKRRDSVPL